MPLEQEKLLVSKSNIVLRQDFFGTEKSIPNERTLPPVPEFGSESTLEDFFQQLDEVVIERWRDRSRKDLEPKFLEWRKSLSVIMRNKKDPEAEKLRQFMSWEAFEQIASAQKMGALSSLRSILPEAWNDLMTSFCQRQEDKLVVGYTWAKQLTGRGPAWAEYGLLTMMETSLASVGFNQAYFDYLVNEIPGAQRENVDDRVGREYFVKVKREERNIYFPYAVAYPSLKTAAENFSKEAEIIRERVKDGLLPESYLTLQKTLTLAARAFSSEEKNRPKIEAIWLDLRKASLELLESDCPVTFIAETTLGSRSETEPGVRIGMKTPKTKELERRIRKYGIKEAVENVLVKNFPRISRLAKVPEVFINFQTFTFGTNLESVTRAEQEMFFIVLHENDIFKRFEGDRKVLERAFPEVFKRLRELSYSEQEAAIFLPLLLHEYGHALISTYIKAVEKRLGYSELSNMVDEIKGDSCGIFLLNRLTTLSEKQVQVVFGLWFATTVAEACLDQSSDAESFGGTYFYSFIAELSTLLKKKGIERNDKDGYVVNMPRSLQVLEEMAQGLMKLYANSGVKKTTFEKIGQKTIDTYKNNRAVRQFVRRVRKRALSEGEEDPLFLYQ